VMIAPVENERVCPRKTLCDCVEVYVKRFDL